MRHPTVSHILMCGLALLGVIGVVDFDWYFWVLHSALTGAVGTLVSVNLYELIWGHHSGQVWNEGLRFGANAGSIGLGRVMGEFGNVS